MMARTEATVPKLDFRVRWGARDQDCRELCRTAFPDWLGQKDEDLEVRHVFLITSKDGVKQRERVPRLVPLGDGE